VQRVGDLVLRSNSKDLDHCQAYEVLSTRLTGSGEDPIDRIALELRTWELTVLSNKSTLNDQSLSRGSSPKQHYP
jgi:hypothetical protein